MVTARKTQQREPLSRERVLETAIALADEEGIEALTMRHLAERLDVEAMSLYYHVANKEAMLDGIVDSLMLEVSDEIGGFAVPDGLTDWKAEVERRILGARRVMMRHKWAPDLIETRTNIGPGVLFHFHGILGVMVEGGFSYDLAHHALHAFGSRAIGFTQELFTPDNAAQDEANEEAFQEMAEHLPYLVGMMSEIVHDDADDTLGWCDDETEFKFGLDIVLEGLERRREAQA